MKLSFWMLPAVFWVAFMAWRLASVGDVAAGLVDGLLSPVGIVLLVMTIGGWWRQRKQESVETDSGDGPLL